MINFVFLNLILGIFLLITIFETTLKKQTIFLNKLNYRFLIFWYFILLIIIPILYMGYHHAYYVANQIYLNIIFIILVAGHFIYLLMGSSKLKQTALFVILFIFYFFFFKYSSTLTKNIFIVLGLVWLGPFLSQAKLLSKKTYILLSFAWLIYSGIFLLLRSKTINIFNKTETLRLPFSVSAGFSYLGIVDLFIPNLFISVLKSIKKKMISCLIFILSNILFGLYVIRFTSISLLPITNFWIIVSYFILLFR